MIVEVIKDSFLVWLQILIFPFSNFDLLWRMIPIYLNGILVSVYSGRPSHTGAIFGGVVALLAGGDWIRAYIAGDFAVQLNWIIAVCFCVYGGISLIVGLLKRYRLYWLFGRRSILTFFAISFYPIQSGYLYNLDPVVLKAIFIMAIPMIIIFEIVTSLLGRILNRNSVSDYSFGKSRYSRRI